MGSQQSQLIPDVLKHLKETIKQFSSCGYETKGVKKDEIYRSSSTIEKTDLLVRITFDALEHHGLFGEHRVEFVVQIVYLKNKNPSFQVEEKFSKNLKTEDPSLQ